jgi:hypothetical protein
MAGKREREGRGAVELRKKKGAGEEEGEALTAGGRTAGGDGRAEAGAGELREVGERGDRAWGLGEGEREGGFGGRLAGGPHTAGRQRRPNRPRRARRARRGGGWAARGARGRPRLGRRAGPRPGGGRAGPPNRLGRTQGGKGKERGELGRAKKPAQGERGAFLFPLFPLSSKFSLN